MRRRARDQAEPWTESDHLSDADCADLRELMVPLLETQSAVYRRELFSCRLREELERASRDQASLSVLLVQPRSHGRPDSASAQSIGRFLMCMARQQDTPARLRPGLFALLLPDVDHARAERVSRALELELAAEGYGGADPCRVSPLTYPDDRAELEDLAARAAGSGRLRRPPSAA